MNEVKRYTFKGAAGSYVYANDFDKVIIERDAALALSVEKIMIDVVPGYYGMGEEVYAKSITDIENLLNKLCDAGELLQDRVDILESLLYKYYRNSDVCAFMAKDIEKELKLVRK